MYLLIELTKLALGRLGRENEQGQGLAEYALILALIAIVAIVALLFLGGQISSQLSFIGSTLEDKTGP